MLNVRSISILPGGPLRVLWLLPQRDKRRYGDAHVQCARDGRLSDSPPFHGGLRLDGDDGPHARNGRQLWNGARALA